MVHMLYVYLLFILLFCCCISSKAAFQLEHDDWLIIALEQGPLVATLGRGVVTKGTDGKMVCNPPYHIICCNSNTFCHLIIFHDLLRAIRFMKCFL